jgi:hypothetical protein
MCSSAGFGSEDDTGFISDTCATQIRSTIRICGLCLDDVSSVLTLSSVKMFILN